MVTNEWNYKSVCSAITQPHNVEDIVPSVMQNLRKMRNFGQNFQFSAYPLQW